MVEINRSVSLAIAVGKVSPLRDALCIIASRQNNGNFCLEDAALEIKALFGSFILEHRDELPDKLRIGSDLILNTNTRDIVPAKFKTIKQTPVNVWYHYSGIIASAITNNLR